MPELLAEFEATGDQAPFEEIVRRYAGMVYNVCYQVSRDAHDAEDATQAVFLTLAVRSKTAQKIQYLGPWLQRVAQRLSLDMKRSKKRRGARELKHHDMNVSRWEDNNQPVDLGMDELRGILRDEIDQLPAKYRMPLILHYFGGLKPDEMSKELNIKANTLGVRLHRARKMLGESLQKRGIVVGGAMLSTALASLIPLYIQQTVANAAYAVSAQQMIGQQLVANEIAARVLGTMRVANRAALLGKIKAVTAAVAIGVAAVAGGKEIIQQLRVHGIELRRSLDLERWLVPLFDRIRLPIRLGSSEQRLEAALATVDTSTVSFSSAPAWFQLPEATIELDPTNQHEFALASPPNSLTPDSLVMERTPIAIPIPLDSPVHQRKAVSNYSPASTARLPVATALRSADRPVAQQRGTTISAPPTTIAPRLSDANVAFMSARGTYLHSSGIIEQPTITIDSATASLRSFHVSGGEVRTQRLTVAEVGSATMIHSGGLVQAQELAIGVQPGSVGAYQLSGEAKLQANVQRIGIEGTGSLEQNGGTNLASQVAMGEGARGVGQYTLRSGQLYTNDLRVGISGRGAYTQTGGLAVVSSLNPAGGLTVAERDSSEGSVSIHGGELLANNVFVALAGDGRYQISGGKTVTNKIVLGGTDSADATFRALGGEIVFDSVGSSNGSTGGGAVTAYSFDSNTLPTASSAWTVATSSAVPNIFAVGVNGNAVVELGGRNKTVKFSEASAQSATPVVVGATPGSDAVFRGWGEVALHGVLIHNGKFIADGMGKQRALDFSSVSGVQNTIDNDVDGDNGFYAQRSGSMKLPPINVRRSGDYNWGESPNDPVPDLVNSVRLGFNGVSTPGKVSLSLLAPELARDKTAAPAGELFVGFWEIERSGLSANSTDLLIRYDEQLVRNIGLTESALSLWTFDGEWERLPQSESVLDASQNLIGGTATGEFEYFAVALSSDYLGSSLSFLDGRLTIPGLAVSDSAARTHAFINEISLVAPDAADSARGAGVPEPAAGAIIAGAALMMMRRGRRTAF